MFSSVSSDLRFALRMLRKNPGFTATVVLILAIGIGGNTAMFSVMKAVFLQPLPFEDPDRLTILWGTSADGGYGTVSGPNFLDWREQNRSFEELAAVSEAAFNFTGWDEPERIRGAYVTASLFDVLGTNPAAGRAILPEDQQPGNTQVVVLSHGLWTRRFGADSSVIGSSASIGGELHTVVGVMPRGFDVPRPWRLNEPTEAWFPFPVTLIQENRGGFNYLILGRLRQGVSLSTAQVDLDAIAERLSREYPATNAGRGVWIVPLHSAMYGQIGGQMILIFGAAGLVLLIACGNIVGLLLARATSRQPEIAVRIALGARRMQLIQALLAETVPLSLAGGIAGVLMANWGLATLRSLIPASVPRVDQIALDSSALLFALLLSLIAGALFGLIPAATVSRVHVGTALKESSGRGHSGSRGGERIRGRFVVAQLALTLVLLNCGALLLRSYVGLRSEDQGFDHENTLTMAVSLSGPRYERVPERYAFLERAARELAALPGVHHAGAASKLPLLGGTNGRVRAEHQPPRAGPADGIMTEFTVVVSDYIDAIGVPLLRGRTPTVEDTVGAHYGAVVNRTLAEKLWPDEDPIGKRFTFFENPPRWLTVIGVVSDVRQWGPEAQPLPEAYVPYPFFPMQRMYLTIGADADAAGLIGLAKARLLELDREQPVSRFRTMAEVLRSSLERREFYTLMTGLFAVVALLLAAVGLYGVLSQHVARRTQEIGLRMALGAKRGDVMRLVLRRGLRLAAAGLAIGGLGLIVSVSLLASLLYGVTPWDPLALAATGGSLTGIALLGCLMPALRATRVQPIVALRGE